MKNIHFFFIAAALACLPNGQAYAAEKCKTDVVCEFTQNNKRDYPLTGMACFGFFLQLKQIFQHDGRPDAARVMEKAADRMFKRMQADKHTNNLAEKDSKSFTDYGDKGKRLAIKFANESEKMSLEEISGYMESSIKRCHGLYR